MIARNKAQRSKMAKAKNKGGAKKKGEAEVARPELKGTQVTPVAAGTATPKAAEAAKP